MKYKLFFVLGISFLFCIIFIPQIKSDDFTIQMVPTYHLSGGQLTVNGMNYYGYGQVEVYNSLTKFDGISFDVVGTANVGNARILNMTITATPDTLQNSFLQNNTIQSLAILQTKTLWSSGVINLLNYPNGEMVNYTVSVVGTSEITKQNFFEQANYSIIVNHPEPTFWQNIGNTVYPGDYITGVVISVILAILVTLILIWLSRKIKNGRKRE